jgi:putative nucleotidyltransferase with HDIG domain
MSEAELEAKLTRMEQESERLRREIQALRQALARGDDALANTEIKLTLAYLATIQALMRAIEAKDPYTLGHSAMVSRVALAISRQLGLSEEERERLRIAGILLDVGKIGVPHEILVKTGELTEAERKALETHVKIGAEIVEPVIYPWEIATLIYQHHERLDGSGYPQALTGDQIEFDARILGLADAFVAMLADRAYRRAYGEKAVLEHFTKQAGRTFDDACVAALAQLLAGDAELREEVAKFTAGAARS